MILLLKKKNNFKILIKKKGNYYFCLGRGFFSRYDPPFCLAPLIISNIEMHQKSVASSHERHAYQLYAFIGFGSYL